MFPYQGPTAAAKSLRDLMRHHGNKMPARLSEKLDAAVDLAAPVLTVLYGMEWLWSAFQERDGDDQPVVNIANSWRASALQTLGELAAEIGYGRHQEKGARGEAIAAWVAREQEGLTNGLPTPELDENYRLAPPPPSEPPVPTETPEGPTPPA